MLVVDNKAQRASVAEEIKRQVQTGKLDVFEQGIYVSYFLSTCSPHVSLLFDSLLLFHVRLASSKVFVLRLPL